MKAIILAAGYATRLYPLTLNIPKPLLEINGKSILSHIVDNIHQIQEIDEIFVVTNDKFFEHFMDWKNSLPTNRVTVLNDGTSSNDDRLGSLGDIDFVVEKAKLDDDLLVVAGDNLFEFSLLEMHKAYQEKKAIMMAAHDVKDIELARLYGVVKLNEQGKVIHFEEKPPEPKSTVCGTAIYIYPSAIVKKLVSFVRSHGQKDKSGDFIEWIYTQEPVYTFPITGLWYDIGSVEQLEDARRNYG